MRRHSVLAVFGILLGAATLGAQLAPPPAPWRGAGPPPCVGSDGGVYQCPPAPRAIAIRAGRLFDSKTGQMLTKQVVLLSGERITEVGPEAQVKIPAGAQVIDLSQATVLPGLIDAHTHMFNTRGAEDDDGELDADRRAERAGRSAGRLHRGARHELARQRIRATSRSATRSTRAASTARGIRCRRSASCGAPTPPNPARRRTRWPAPSSARLTKARAAVREQIGTRRGLDQAVPGGRLLVHRHGRGAIQVTYPLPVLQALIDETHRLGKKAGCHVLRRRRAEERDRRRLRHHRARVRPESGAGRHDGRQGALLRSDAAVRYIEPYMDDNDAKNTGGKYRMIPIFEKAVVDGRRPPRESRSWWAAEPTARRTRMGRRRSISRRW